MLRVEQVMNIKELSKDGVPIRQIAEMTGHSRNTVRKVLRGEHELKYQGTARASKLDPFKEYVQKRYEETGLSAVRLLLEIRPMGYEGSIVTLRRFLRPFKKHAKRLSKVTVRFETPPGKQAQADWAYCGRFQTPEGKRLSIYVFTMVLCFSRMLYLKFTTSMRMKDLIASHQGAFEFFGGIPDEILYDNMKQVRFGPGQWNEQFLDFANHYGFALRTHRPYRPRTKGKVERTIDYVKDNFLAAREFADLDDVNIQGSAWQDNTANVRIHGTTKKRPVDLFPQDKEKLRPFGAVAQYRFVDPVQRTVSNEAMVSFQNSRYSVPPAFAGHQVGVVADGGTIVVWAGDAIIAEHRQALQPGQCIVNKEHLAELWKITEQQIKPPVERASMRLTFQQAVAKTPLSRYEEVSA